MSLVLKVLDRIKIVSDYHIPDPIQVQYLGRTVTVPDPVALLPLYLAMAPQDRPQWLRRGHWLWTGPTSGGVGVACMYGAPVRVHYYLIYEALHGPDQSGEGFYRSLQHMKDCPHRYCVNPDCWVAIVKKRK